MTTRLGVALLACTGVLSGCVGGVSAEKKAEQCASFADAVAGMHFDAMPSATEARAASDRLDGVIREVGDPAAHDAATQLHSDAHRLADALAGGDTEKAADAFDDVRADIQDAADACDLPATRFLTGSTAGG